MGLDKRKIADILTKEIKQEQINIDEPMKKHTSFKIGGNADIFVKIHTIEELKYVIKISKIEKIPLTVIGNGSNILVRDNGIRGIVVKLEFNQIMIDGTVVTVGAGVKLGELGQRLLQKEITGFEFASGIPGTIGGAVRMNAGAYGGEMKDIIIETKCFDIEQYEKEIQEEKSSGTKCNKSKASEVIVLANEEQEFSYRHSIFMNKKYIILETTLQLEKGNAYDIRNKMQEYLYSRKEKQPVGMPSAGSTFKRGKDYITAKVIDECGLKGYHIGDAEVSNVHAGFIVNKGNATAKDVLGVVKHVQEVVYEKTKKSIELEVEIIGE